MRAITKMPTLDEIFEEDETKIKRNKFEVILNQKPPEKWVLTHPLDSKVKYLPIGRVEFLLTRIFGFGNWEENIIDYKLIANSIAVHLRLTVVNPLTGQKISMDGAGSFPLQTEKGASPMDITKLKSNAVMLAYPAAKSEALKDAAHMLGKVFGSSVMRSEDVSYNSLLPKQTTEDELKEMYQYKKNLCTEEEVKRFDIILNTKEVNSYEKMKTILNSKQNEYTR